MWGSVRSWLALGAAATLAVAWTACGNNSLDPDALGSIQVEVTTSGQNPDVDGYTVTLNDLDQVSVDPNGSVVFQDVVPGQHSIQLGGVNDNCAVEGDNPRSVQLGAGSQADVSFTVTCVVGAQNVIVFGRNIDGVWDIFLMNDDGSGQTNLTNNPSNDERPMTSRDGVRIAFVSNRAGSRDVWTMLIDGTGQQNLTKSNSRDDRPSWFADGQRLAFVSNRDGSDDIWLMDRDGTNLERITGPEGDDDQPAVSPDGTKIAFSSDRDGDHDIWVMDVDGNNPVNLTQHEARDARPAWSPDGTKIVFHSDRDGVQEVYVMNATDGSELTNLSNSPTSNDAEPAFSPDGSQIAFVSDRDGTFDVWLMDADGSNQVNISESPHQDEDPAWES